MQRKTPCPVLDCKAIATTEFSERVTSLPELERDQEIADTLAGVAKRMLKLHEDGKHEPVKG